MVPVVSEIFKPLSVYYLYLYKFNREIWINIKLFQKLLKFYFCICIMTRSYHIHLGRQIENRKTRKRWKHLKFVYGFPQPSFPNSLKISFNLSSKANSFELF